MARRLIPFGFGTSSPDRPGTSLLAQLQREMNRVFEDAFSGFGAPAIGGTIASPRLDISESDNELRIRAELPGVSENDIQVELADDVLTIRGEKKSESESTDDQESYHMIERSFGSFARSIRLPFAVNPDQVQASFKNGVLTITIPKSAAQQKAHRIQVQADQAQQGRIDVDRAAAGGKPGATPSQQTSAQQTSAQQENAPAAETTPDQGTAAHR